MCHCYQPLGILFPAYVSAIKPIKKAAGPGATIVHYVAPKSIILSIDYLQTNWPQTKNLKSYVLTLLSSWTAVAKGAEWEEQTIFWA